ncbi:hypothetical protein [Vibrio sp. McD22-P3]|uniref:hypothetical protein n=1 Tax=Vibrio sp. McD22-P3 TaxID=2724880 RepID=UPI001F3A0A34|nr:hypothetical protein [Vibrio sp. McD22-P3]MCF4175266.1 hypothetical protein [Vibrio sp. McD22-P3]
MLTAGFYDTAFETRVFPILGFVVFYKIGHFLVSILFGGDLGYLPLMYFILSNAFLSLLVVCTYKVFHKKLSVLAVVGVILFILFLPVGWNSNEIYGRVLNLGFVFPFFQIVLLTSLFDGRKNNLYVIFVVLFATLSSLTFPVGMGISVATAVLLFFYSFRSNAKKYYITCSLLLLLSVVFCVLKLSASTFTSEGGADLPLRVESLIEFSIARTLLYPIVFSFYKHLNDFIVVGIFLAVITLLVRSINSTYSSNGDKASFYILLNLWLGFFIYWIATVFMRIGLSSLFNDYGSTFPDRYFTGLNMLFFLTLCYTIEKSDLKHVSKVVALVVMISPVVLTSYSRIELNKPRMSFNSVAPWNEVICNDFSKEGTSIIDIPPKGWTIDLTKALDKEILSGDCKEPVRYDFWPLKSLSPPVTKVSNVPEGIKKQTLEILSLNSIEVDAERSGTYQLRTTGNDPSTLIIRDWSVRNNRYERNLISIRLDSAVDGVAQLYYRGNSNKEFSEANSLLFEITKGVNDIYLSVDNSVPEKGLRFDLPEGYPNTYKIHISSSRE